MSGGIARERAATAAVLFAMALVVLDAGIIAVALPTIALGLGETPARTMLIVSAYQLALLVGLLPCAHLADRFGYRRLFVGGVMLFASAAALCTLAPTLPLLVGARALQGLGGAAIMALGIALLRFALGPERLGTAIAWNAMVVAICAAAAPLAGALALSSVGWRWLFVICLPMAALALLAAPCLPVVKAGGRIFNLLSISLYALAAACLVLSTELAKAAPLTAVAVAGGALGCGWWLRARERRMRAPLVPIDLLTLGPVRSSVIASAFFFTGQSAGLLALPFYLQLSLGCSAATTGLVVASWPMAVAATSRVANRLADRFSSGALCAAGAIVLAAGLVAIALWPIQGSIAPLVACAIVCGMGFGLFQVPNNRNLFLSAPADRSAAAGGLQGTARLAGQTAGALFVGFVLSVASIEAAPRVAIGLAAVAALLAARVSWSRASIRVGASSDWPPSGAKALPAETTDAPEPRWCAQPAMLRSRIGSGDHPSHLVPSCVRLSNACLRSESMGQPK